MRNQSHGPRKDTRIKINNAIRAKELRVVGADGKNLGVLSLADAQKAADEAKLDLIEISPNAKPPVAKIMDYGQYRYETKRKASEVKAKAHVTETKAVQVKIGTGEHDQQLKAKRIAEWLSEGHRVKVDLFLWGRYKYMEPDFLKERLERFLKIIPVEYKIADEIKKSPKGFTTTLERDGKAKYQQGKIIEETESDESADVESEKMAEEPAQKSKKKSLDELLDIEGGVL
ncbi:MAG: translation initiation factor IF-3 [Candidatus Paceibacterota bacterium]|nr:translation initiation factor IF-3 [Candidatus Magasanikbacteria bacterium]